MTLFFTLTVCLLLLVYAGLIFAYWRAWITIPVFISKTDTRRTTISVLIPARNEEKNIPGCLASLSHQSYPRHLFEVIVLDDHSSDGTVEAVRSFAGDLRLRCLRMAEISRPENVKAHKKFAIDTGVSAAGGELIVTTDADCTFHPEWLSTIAAFYEDREAAFIAAPVRIGIEGRAAGSLPGVFQTLDFITLQGITGAAVDRHWHSMCNGANLAYAKTAFEEAGGFRGIDSIPSGDDMLLMHKISFLHPEKVFFLKSPPAIVTTLPVSGWAALVHQRVRWASKTDHYDDKRIFRVLLLVYIVNLSLPVLGVAAVFDGYWGWLLLFVLAGKTIVEYLFVRDVAKFFGQHQLMVYFPFLQPLHICYTVIIGWMGKFGSYEWKDRKIQK